MVPNKAGKILWSYNNKTVKVYVTKQFELYQNYKIQHARQKLRENVEEYSQIPTMRETHWHLRYETVIYAWYYTEVLSDLQ
jgi:hypothetical protein